MKKPPVGGWCSFCHPTLDAAGKICIIIATCGYYATTQSRRRWAAFCVWTPERPMNKMQSAFVDEYLVDLNATQAAIRAGYSAKTAGAIGHKLLKVAEIQSSIAERSKARSERTEITQDLVLTDIELIKRDAMREALDKEGNKAMINHTAALKACELQGRHLQMWNDKLALMNKDGSPLLQNLTVNLVQARGSD